jgi:crotonobetainyl-CoA hydratase
MGEEARSLAVVLEEDGPVLEITLDRPKANAIDRETSVALGAAFARFRDRPDLRAAIVTGAGDRFFSAGWDLKAGAAGEHERQDFGIGGFAGLTEMWDLNKPVIAAVNGLAVGGGFELALACDLIFAAAHAEFFLPEARVGNVADAGGAQRLPRRLPYHIAMELLLTGRRLTAADAARWGVANSVLPAAALMPAVRAVAHELAAAAPLSIEATKEIVREGDGLSVRETFARMHAGAFPTYERMLVSDDRQEGPAAFAESRPPNFRGR